MKTNHTPGPWKAVHAFINNEPNRWIVTADTWGGPNVADCGDREANARLIAAAPDMLEALRSLQNISGCLRRATLAPADRGADMNYVIDKARDAINKATLEEVAA